MLWNNRNIRKTTMKKNLKPCTRRARLGRREVRGGERLSFSMWRVALKKNRKTEKVYANLLRMLYQKQTSAVLAQHMCTAGRVSKHDEFFYHFEIWCEWVSSTCEGLVSCLYDYLVVLSTRFRDLYTAHIKKLNRNWEGDVSFSMSPAISSHLQPSPAISGHLHSSPGTNLSS